MSSLLRSSLKRLPTASRQGTALTQCASREALWAQAPPAAGELAAIHVPDQEDEAIRDLIRCRTAAVNDQRQARNRLKGFLLRLGFRYTGKSSWTDAHKRYLSGLLMPQAPYKTRGPPAQLQRSTLRPHDERTRNKMGATRREGFCPERAGLAVQV